MPAARGSADNDIEAGWDAIPIVTGFRMAIGRDRVAADNSAGDLAGDVAWACLIRLLGGSRQREILLSCPCLRGRTQCQR